MECPLVPLSKREYLTLEILKVIGATGYRTRLDAIMEACSLADAFMKRTLSIEREVLEDAQKESRSYHYHLSETGKMGNPPCVAIRE